MRKIRTFAAAVAASFLSLCSLTSQAVEFATTSRGGVAAIKADGTLWTWGHYATTGRAEASQLGRPSPGQVGTDLWTRLAAGDTYFLAIRADGSLWAWGEGFPELFGNPASPSRSEPTRIGTATDWVEVAAGLTHAAAVKSDGTLWGWGSDSEGQLSLYLPSPVLAPTQISVSNQWTKVAAGEGFTLAIRSDGSMAQLGFGLFTMGPVGVVEPPFFLEVPGTGWSDVSASRSHAVALQQDGSLWAWGRNEYSEVENAFPGMHVFEPTQMGLGFAWQSIGACNGASVAVRSDKTVWAIGDGYIRGDGFLEQLPIGLQFEKVACNAHGLALRSDGTLYSFGKHFPGSLGDGSSQWSPPSGTSTGLADWQTVFPSQSSETGAGLKTDGTLWAWGSIIGMQGSRPMPITVSDVLDVDNQVAGPWKQFLLNGIEGLGLTADGTLYRLWGTYAPSPFPAFYGETIGAPGEWGSIAMGDHHALGIKADGSLWAWGDNSFGQLGVGPPDLLDPYVFFPVQVGTETNWKSISAGEFHSAAIRTDGTLWLWGQGTKSQLGLGGMDDLHQPTLNAMPHLWQSVAAGADHTLALTTAGALYAAGQNAHGEIGDGTTDPQAQFRLIDNQPITQIAAGRHTSFAIRSSGELLAWGANGDRALGDGSFHDRTRPVQNHRINELWKKVVAMGSGLVAIRTDNRLWAWGPIANSFSPPTVFHRVPVPSKWNAFTPSASLTWATIADDYVLDFDLVGMSASQVLTLRAGPADVNIGSITAAPSFVFQLTHACPATLAANTSCDITVTFRPFQLRASPGTLNIVSNATIGNVPLPIAGIGVEDPVPDAFAFATLTDVAPGSILVSNPITPTGFNSPALIQITGGEYCISSTASCSCDQRAFTTSPFSILVPGQSMCVRHTSSTAPMASRVTTLTLRDIPTGGTPPGPITGIVSGTFMTTTARAISTVALTSMPNPSLLNEPVTFTATVSGTFGTPEGSVTFKEGAAVLGTSTLSGGAATLGIANLPVGPHLITAQYEGSAAYLPFTSAPLVHGVTSGDSPALGTVLDLNNDGREDVLVPAGPTATLYLMDGTTVTDTIEISGPGTAWSLTHVADFNGDGKSDLVWQAAAGEIELWLMDGLTPFIQQRLTGLPPGAVVEQIGDFNGDGKSDLVFVGTGGQVDAWLMNGVALSSSATLASTTAGLTLTQVGDLDADGKSDIIWTTDAGAILMWLMDGLVPHDTSELVPPTLGLATLAMSDGGSKKTEPLWRVVALGDFDGNGRKDLVVSNKEGRTVVLLMSGLQVTGNVEVAPAKSKVDRVHAVDLSGDGMDDIVIEFHDGTVQARTLEGTLITGTAVLPQDGKKMSILRTGDLNGDGKGDLIWRGKGDRSLEVWIMDGLSIRNRQVLRSGR